MKDADINVNKMLIVVDPQIDFISGTLPVPGAQPAMDALARYIQTVGDEYVCIVITADWHPYRHMSFEDEGGQWPRHCVAFSQGASIYEPLLTAANGCDNVVVLTKGTEEEKEEYSVFQNETSGDLLRILIQDLRIGHIDICGLAGDICVANTARDAIDIYGDLRVNVLQQFSPRINP